MQEEDQLRVEDTNEEALASKMYSWGEADRPSRRVTSWITSPRNSPNTVAKEISLFTGVTGLECISFEDSLRA
jgi:hypothetical protein